MSLPRRFSNVPSEKYFHFEERVSANVVHLCSYTCQRAHISHNRFNSQNSFLLALSVLFITQTPETLSHSFDSWSGQWFAKPFEDRLLAWCSCCIGLDGKAHAGRGSIVQKLSRRWATIREDTRWKVAARRRLLRRLLSPILLVNRSSTRDIVLIVL